jgi:DNA-binding PadR family transcriptional regulator
MLSKNSSYGYELMKKLEEQCGEIIDVGNLYRTLRRMEKDGWVTSDWKEGENGPKKRIYIITSDGEDFLHSAALGLKQSKAQIELFLKRYKAACESGYD